MMIVIYGYTLRFMLLGLCSDHPQGMLIIIHTIDCDAAIIAFHEP